MPVSQLESYLKNQNSKQFSSQTFSDFRQELLEYANLYYKDNIVDFSEVSLGGMLLDFAAIVGDSLVFYAEQQFNELDYQTATDPATIIKHLQRVNIKDSKASPSSASIDFTIEVDRDINSKDFDLKPDSTYVPVIKSGTILSSSNGIIFTLQEDLDFNISPIQEEGDEDINGNITSLLLTKKGVCVSGDVSEEVFDLTSAASEYFLSVELEKENITNILAVFDNENNEYFEVDYLSQSTVFKKVKDSNDNYLTIIPAPFRFTREEDFLSGRTKIRFGNGDGKSIKDNVFANPEDLLLPIKDKEVVSRVDLDPGLLLENSSLGVSPRGKIITVIYKHGGGVSHNVSPGAINIVIGDPIITFPNSIIDNNYEEETSKVISSLFVNNENSSVGGTQPLSLDELKLQIPNAMKAQSRIITYEDLLSRILTMPSDFGRINKAVVLDNPFTRTSKDLFITCKDSEGYYIESSDIIKSNLSKYLNEFRLIGDAFNILDVPVFNFGIQAQVKIKSGFDPFSVILDINTRIVSFLRFDLMQIGSPIDTKQISLIIESTDGVSSLITPKKSLIVSKTSENSFYDLDLNKTLSYNTNIFNPQTLFEEGLIFPPRGGIFEMRYTFKDISIAAN